MPNTNTTQTTITADDDVATVINVFDVEPAHQQELVAILTDGTEQVIRERSGFVSVNLLASNDGSRVVNYAQWRTLDDVKAALADPDVQALAGRAAAIAQAAPHVYTVVSTHHT